MNIILYTTKSESNRVTKTLENAATFSGTLRERTNVMYPSFVIQGDVSLVDYNYAYIEDFKRYYFITDLVSERNNLFRIDLTVDVLMTYKDQIKELTAVVDRQEKKFNLYLQDTEFNIDTRMKVVTKKFPRGFDGNSYILGTVGASAVEVS